MSHHRPSRRHRAMVVASGPSIRHRRGITSRRRQTLRSSNSRDRRPASHRTLAIAAVVVAVDSCREHHPALIDRQIIRVSTLKDRTVAVADFEADSGKIRLIDLNVYSLLYL